MLRWTALLLLAATPALADPAAWDQRLDQCQSAAETVDDLRQCKQAVFDACMEEAPAGATDADATCQAADAKAWDARLNALWVEVRGQADTYGVRDDLKAAQKAWIGFRDANCGYAAQLARKTGGAALWQEQFCLSDMTAERVFQFRLMLAGG